MASLQHLGDNRWRVRVYVGKHPTTEVEQQVSRKFEANGKRAAERKVAEIETALRAEFAAKEAKATTRRGSMNELVDDWLAIKSRDKSPSTMIAYNRHAASIKKRFGKIQASELTGREIDAWYSELMAGGMSAASIQHRHRVLRAILSFGYKKRGLPSKATDQASPPSHMSPEVSPPATTAIVAMLTSFPNSPDVQWARAVRLLIFTGLRRGEVVGLKWDGWTPGTDTTPGRLRVDHSILELPGGKIHIGPPKGKRSRTMALDIQSDIVLDQQRRWQERHNVTSPWVFPDLRADPKGGKPRRPGWVSLMWGRWRKKNAPGVALHSLRHHFATMLLDAGTPVNTVQRMLGHADASTTLRIYGHRTDEGEAKALEASSKAFSSS
jgi:integrase